MPLWLAKVIDWASPLARWLPQDHWGRTQLYGLAKGGGWVFQVVLHCAIHQKPNF